MDQYAIVERSRHHVFCFFQCDTLLCLLRLRNYVDENNALLLDKVSEGLDKWAAGTLFEEKLPKIKEFCMRAQTTGPPHSCEQAKLFQCMGSLWSNVSRVFFYIK